MPTPNDIPTYILLKDLPDAKAGIELVFDDEGYYYQYKASNNEPCWYLKEYVENNPEWFQKKSSKTIKEQPMAIEINITKLSEKPLAYLIHSTGEWSSEKIPAIKQEIEKVLNPTQTTDSIKDSIPYKLFITADGVDIFPMDKFYAVT